MSQFRYQLAMEKSSIYQAAPVVDRLSSPGEPFALYLLR